MVNFLLFRMELLKCQYLVYWVTGYFISFYDFFLWDQRKDTGMTDSYPSHPSSLPIYYTSNSSIKIYSNVILSWHLLFDGLGPAHLPSNIDFKIPKGNHKTRNDIFKKIFNN